MDTTITCFWWKQNPFFLLLSLAAHSCWAVPSSLWNKLFWLNQTSSYSCPVLPLSPICLWRPWGELACLAADCQSFWNQGLRWWKEEHGGCAQGAHLWSKMLLFFREDLLLMAVQKEVSVLHVSSEVAVLLELQNSSEIIFGRTVSVVCPWTGWFWFSGVVKLSTEDLFFVL